MYYWSVRFAWALALVVLGVNKLMGHTCELIDVLVCMEYIASSGGSEAYFI